MLPYTVHPLSPMRRIIAARMTQAVRTIPHFRLTAEIEIDSLLEVRRTLQDRNPEVRLSLNDFFIKACAAALMDTPELNIQWMDGEIRQFKSADISVVTAVEGGVTTPIVRSAESKTVWEVSQEMRDLLALAAKGALKLAQIQGGTFSVSNLGMYGVDQFDAIINPPQCAILAIGRARPQWVVTSTGELRVVKIISATLSVDHRALDGVAASSFMSALRRHIEHPM